jgi:hypothetical protein
MARANTKEFLACLAFAYFMNDKNYKNNPQHKENWINTFRDFKVTDLRKKYKDYLEPNFDFGSLKIKYSFERGSGDSHLYAIYNQMVTLFDSNLLDLTKQYRIYGQDSNFVQVIKNQCLERLMSVFSESFSASAKGQDLNPADFYIVDFNRFDEIKRKFTDNIIKPKEDTTILLNYKQDKSKTYESMISEYFRKKELIPISHKMPEGKDPFTSAKVGGNVSNLGNISKKNIDPYSQLLVALYSKTPREVEKLIDNVIEIKYNLWDIRESSSSSSWKLIFDFNYKKLDPAFDDSRFALEPLPSQGSGSFNGKFYIQKGQSKQTPWVAGMAPKSLEPFLKSYSGYNNIMSHLGRKRVKVFDDVIYSEISRGTQSKQQKDNSFREIQAMKEYKDCVRFLSDRKFHTFNELRTKVSPFFVKLGQINGFEEYQKQIIQKIRSEGGFGTDLNSIRPERLYEHYISLQMSYFLFVGGQSFRQFLKKSIFFTIFGAITKRGFNKISNGGMVNLVKKQVNAGNMFKDVEASLTSAPHVILL